MKDFLIDKLCVEFGRLLFQQTVVIPIETNYTSPFADFFVYSYEAEYIKGLFRNNKKK